MGLDPGECAAWAATTGPFSEEEGPALTRHSPEPHNTCSPIRLSAGGWQENDLPWSVADGDRRNDFLRLDVNYRDVVRPLISDVGCLAVRRLGDPVRHRAHGHIADDRAVVRIDDREFTRPLH